MGEGPPKAFRLLAGRPIVLRALDAFARISEISERVLVVRPEDAGSVSARWAADLANVRVVAGGAMRQDSVLAGVRALSESCEFVLVHDAARPLVRETAVRAVMETAVRTGAAIVALSLKDTLKRADRDGRILETIPRDGIWRAQTPQAFRRSLLLDALERARAGGAHLTDEASAVERIGRPVAIVEGHETNIKITTPDDLRLAEAILAAGF